MEELVCVELPQSGRVCVFLASVLAQVECFPLLRAQKRMSVLWW